MVAIGLNNNNYYLCNKPVYFSIECRVQTTVSVDQFFFIFNNLKLNYTLTYRPRGACDLPQFDCLPDNILLHNHKNLAIAKAGH